jgi:hypothetical protein
MTEENEKNFPSLVQSHVEQARRGNCRSNH